MTDEVSKTGVFLDPDGKVVTSQPEEGVQLVAPGGVIDANAQRAIDAAKTAAADEVKAPEPAPVLPPVTTKATAR